MPPSSVAGYRRKLQRKHRNEQMLGATLKHCRFPAGLWVGLRNSASPAPTKPVAELPSLRVAPDGFFFEAPPTVSADLWVSDFKTPPTVPRDPEARGFVRVDERPQNLDPGKGTSP